MDVPDPRTVRERNNIVLHSDPCGGWNGRVQPQALSHNIIKIPERLDLLLIRRIRAEKTNLVTQTLLHLDVVG